MMVTVALSASLVILVLALTRVPMLRAVAKREGVSPRIVVHATRQPAIDPKLGTSSGVNLDLVVGVRS